eukprot:gene34511-44598_t
MTDFANTSATDEVVQASYYSATAAIVSKVNDAELAWLDEEMSIYNKRSQKSVKLLSEASVVLPAGVASCYHRSPTPFFVKSEESKGSKVVDTDGNRYIDFHSGYGVCSLGHQHPNLMSAWNKVLSTASITGVPTQDAAALANQLVLRFKKPFWRFMNSGTEATLDAVRLARAWKGRKYIIKPEASYHGHHDAVWVSVDPIVDFDRKGSDPIASVPFCEGIPSDIFNLTRVVEFNNIESFNSVVKAFEGEIAGIVLEPIMFNCGIIKAQVGYLNELVEICRAKDIAVIYDLVKIGVNISQDHLKEYPSPDMVTLGKALGGGYPIGAVGMTSTFKDLIVDRKVMLAGTFNGGSYAMSIASAVLDILTPQEQLRIERVSNDLADSCREIIHRYKLPAHIVNLGNKGCIFVQNGPATEVHNYRQFAHHSNRIIEQVLPVYFQNRDVWIQWKDEWTISAQHSQEDINIFISTFESFAELWARKIELDKA